LATLRFNRHLKIIRDHKSENNHPITDQRTTSVIQVRPASMVAYTKSRPELH
jgi:hypothetical protein